MARRYVPFLLACTLLAGCGVQAAPGAQTRAASAASAAATQLDPVWIFDRKPSKGLVKQPAPIHASPILDPNPMPLSITKIRSFAAFGLAEAEKKDNWNERFGCTDAALAKVDAVKLDTHGLNNVPAKVGIMGARAFGYIGMPPTHENRYKVQAVTLTYLNTSEAEASLAKGSPIFKMCADMLEVTTGWDQGFRVGVSVLTTLKENYKDREVSKACREILDKAVSAPSKEEAYGTMVTGLKDLAAKVQ